MSLTVRQLACIREQRLLFRGVQFTLQPGQALHVSGANGVGKSTLLRILAGLRRGDQGQILWQQQPMEAEHYRQQLFFLGHQTGLLAELTPVENLCYGRILAGEPVTQQQAHEALQAVNMDHHAQRWVGQLSAGQQRRVKLAELWLTRRPLWLLDEPFTALDVQGVAQLQQRIHRHLTQQGMVVFTTHQPIESSQWRPQSLHLTGH